MADLKTTTEERARLRDALEHDRLADVGATEVAAAIAVLDDLDTLLAENAKLRAVAEAARIAARVRQEPGLLERLVAAGADFHVTECVDGRWRVTATARDGNDRTDMCTAADVPATLARLAGLEVSRG